LILEQFLMLCGEFINELIQENNFSEDMENICNAVNSAKDERKKRLQELLEDFEFKFTPATTPLNNRMVVKGIVSSKCTVFSSKKAPILISMENYNTEISS